MLTTVLLLSVLVSCVAAAALRTQRNGSGFSLEAIDGESYFGYGVAPASFGEAVTVEFYDVDFAPNNCSELRVDIYANGYLKAGSDLVATLCQPSDLAHFTHTSSRGFFLQMRSSPNVHGGQIKARFHANGALKVTHEILQG